MENLQVVRNKLVNFYKENPRTVIVVFGATGLYIANKLYKKRKYSQKIFNKKDEIKDKAILITGCDTGFGNAMALKLSINLGYQVIATCLKQDSVNDYLSNSSFTANNSTAVVLDVTNEDNIKSVKQFTMNHLNKTNSILWGLVNNAGIFVPGPFELVPKEIDLYQRNVLFMSPLNIIREFLPLLPGRKNYQTNKFNKTKNNGGRIVNISSVSAKMVFDTRYGVSKGALSYFSHSLRMELSPRFGIWVCPIEPGDYVTSIVDNYVMWGKKVRNKLKDNNKLDLIDIYEFNFDKETQNLKDFFSSDNLVNGDIDGVVNDAIHGLTAKYPQREYQRGWNIIHKLLCCGPWWITEPITILIQQSGSW
eukprot:74047_1